MRAGSPVRPQVEDVRAFAQPGARVASLRVENVSKPHCREF